MITDVKKEIIKQVIAFVFPIFLSTIAIFWNELISTITPFFSIETWSKISIILLGIIIGLIIVSFKIFANMKNKFKMYDNKIIELESKPPLEFDSKIGTYINKSTNIRYCASCYSKNLYSPLKEQINGWQCMVKECNQFIKDPSYKEYSRLHQTNTGRETDDLLKNFL